VRFLARSIVSALAQTSETPQLATSGLHEIDLSASDENHPRIGTPAHFGWLNQILRFVIVLNLVDALLTLWWVRWGLATEANPLLATIVEDHAVLFVTGKLTLVSLGTLLLWRRRHHPLAVIGIFAAFLTYYSVLLFHLQYASNLLRQLLAS
jgi:hypothetical protein